MTRKRDDQTIRIKRHLLLAPAMFLVLGVLAACGLAKTPEPTVTLAPTAAPTATEPPTATEAPTATLAPTAAPEAPSGLDAVLAGARQVMLTWIDNSTTEDGFLVRRALPDTDDPGLELGRPLVDATNFTDNSLECGDSFQYYVASFNSAGISEAVCLRVTLPAQCDDLSQPLVKEECDSAPAAATTGGTGSSGVPTCGDSVCNGTESNQTCPADCSSGCGNQVCDAGESFATCPNDCALAVLCNNNSVCDIGESPSTCKDCSGCNANLVCDAGENAITCPTDCGLVVTCNNNGTCDPGENIATCPADCTLLSTCNNNGVCDAGESLSSCPADCALSSVCNNNGVCDFWETAGTCPADCH